jgi:dihydroorotate dehydrogenase (NAD+) catalytic subunit
MARLLDDVPGVAALEVNISCPNINAGGFCFGWDAWMSREVTEAVRAATTLPIIVKLSPGATDIAEIALAVEEGGADAVSLINTLVGMKIDTRRRRPVLANGTGGLSGPAIKPVAVRMTWQVARVVGIPVVGLGGIMTLDDALEFFMAGASAIQVGTGFFAQPGKMVGIVDELDAWLDAQGCASLSEIVGVALPGGLPERRTRLDPEDLRMIAGT